MNLEKLLAQLTNTGLLYNEVTRNGKTYIECFACAHRCKIGTGKKGICQVRFNDNGQLRVPWGYVAGWQVDPIEKKPFFHAYPGTSAMSYGMLGCDLHCSYCQNWQVSQTLRDDEAGVRPTEVTPNTLVQAALRYGARVIVSTYNEPLISSEWNMAVFEQAKKEGLATGYVSNGNATPEVLDFIRPHTDLYKIDLKTFNDRNYRRLGASLEKVLNGIKEVHRRGFWLEIVTLLIPGFNDSEEELRQIAEFLYEISPDIPWHVTAFHPDYKMTDVRWTEPQDLLKAANLGEDVGLNYIYLGNLPGQLAEWEDTRCPNCKETLIKRKGFKILEYSLSDEGKCPNCLQSIPGIWEKPGNRVSDFPFLIRF